MNIEAILGVVTKGLTLAGTLLSAGVDAAPTITKLIEVTSKGTSVTQAELDLLEGELDAKLIELEEPLNDEE